ncbi:MAG: glucose-6-phosphate isomerase [Planctomycetes bacterium]|nr:glucose-6-phosphate isomerase [Planctomycetota bacterium]
MPNAEIQFKYQGALASVIKAEHGLTDAEWADLGRRTTEIAQRIGQPGARHPYRDAPTSEALSQAGRIREVAARLLAEKWIDDVVVLGIGGSALGLTALKTALCPPYWNHLTKRRRKGHPRLRVMDNVDPAEFHALTELIDPHGTLFVVISKSGETAETITQFLVALELVKRCVGDDWQRHFVIVTEPARGHLRPVARDLGLESFPIDPGLGGRWSLMSPVGLFPAALIGIEIDELLAGAAGMDAPCSSPDFSVNPAAQGAAVQIGLYEKRAKTMTVMMPYSAALRDVADWFRQLWAESLGKRRGPNDFVGQTPIKALGATDQHSQVQLYREGPNDKVFTILSVEDFCCEMPVPEIPQALEGFEYLKGRTMKGLLKAEERATMWALAMLSGRPTVRFTMPRVTPRAVGALLYTLMVQTSIAGEMLGIDAYNQPGVEAGKEAARALMGKTGPILEEDRLKAGLPEEFATYEHLAARIEESPV